MSHETQNMSDTIETEQTCFVPELQESALMAGEVEDTVSAHSCDSDSDVEMQELCTKKDDQIRALKEELEKQRRRVAELEASGSREEHAGCHSTIPDWLAHAGEQEGLSARELQRYVEQDLHTARKEREFDVPDDGHSLHAQFRCRGQDLPAIKGGPSLSRADCCLSKTLSAGDLKDMTKMRSHVLSYVSGQPERAQPIVDVLQQNIELMDARAAWAAVGILKNAEEWMSEESTRTFYRFLRSQLEPILTLEELRLAPFRAQKGREPGEPALSKGSTGGLHGVNRKHRKRAQNRLRDKIRATTLKMQEF